MEIRLIPLGERTEARKVHEGGGLSRGRDLVYEVFPVGEEESLVSNIGRVNKAGSRFCERT